MRMWGRFIPLRVATHDSGESAPPAVGYQSFAPAIFARSPQGLEERRFSFPLVQTLIAGFYPWKSTIYLFIWPSVASHATENVAGSACYLRPILTASAIVRSGEDVP